MAPVFKRNGIYPVFYVWHTGLGENASDLLRRLFSGVAERAGAFTDLTDSLLEQASRPVGRPIWNEMKADAERSFANRPGAGDAWKATRILLDAVAARTQNPMKVHLVGHSAGAILLGNLLARASAEGAPVEGMLGTLSLFAPACTNDFFARTLAPLARKAAPGTFCFYGLSDAAEQADNVAQLYRKSLLYLVSDAFEEREPEPIFGMEYLWPSPSPRGVKRFLAGTGNPPQAEQRRTAGSTTIPPP